MLGLYYELPPKSITLTAQVNNLPSTDEFMSQIEQYEGDAITYFGVVMGVTIVVSFLKSFMS